MRLTGFRGPGNLVRRLDAFEIGRECVRRSIDRKMRTIDAPEFVRIGIDMDENLSRRWDVEERVALRRNLRHASTDEDHEIGLLEARHELRVRPNAAIAGITVMVGRKEGLATEGCGYR